MNYLLSRMSIRWQLMMLTIMFLLGFAVFAVMAHNAIRLSKVDGPRYKQVIQMKDLVADVLPPPEYIIEAHLIVLQMAQVEADPEEVTALVRSLTIVETAYFERHRFWEKTLPDGPLRDLTVVQSFEPAQQFFETVHREFMPLVLSGQSANAQRLVNGKLRQLYDVHRRCIDEIVVISKANIVNEEAFAERQLTSQIFFISILSVAVAFIVGLISHTIGQRIVLRLEQVLGVLDAVTKGDLSRRSLPTGRDEISQMQIALNDAIAASGKNLDAVRNSEQIIRTMHADLESRVSVRTYDLELARTQAVDANRAKSQFLTTMSHELRTPLNGILGMNELLLRTELSERQASYVDASRISGKLLLQLINNVLDLSRIESGKVELDLHECSIESLVYDVVDVMSYGAVQKGIQLPTYVNPSACINAMCDSHRLRQILVNLIGNAIKFTSAGSVTVGAECLQRDEFSARIRMSVTDTGIGIPAEKIKSMFCPFTQAETSTTREFGGTGLGLSICKELVELMGGCIGIDSQIGLGSTFWFEVPLQLIKSKSDVSSPVTNIADIRVLVVSGDDQDRVRILDCLRAWGCPSLTVSTDAEAVQAVTSAASIGAPIRVVLMKLPADSGAATGMDSTNPFDGSDELTKRHKLIEILSNEYGLPVIGFGAQLESYRKHQLRKLGIRHVLHEPLRPSNLFDSLITLAALEPIESTVTDEANLRQTEVAPQLTGHVLVAEDNRINQMFVGEILKHLGCTFDLAEDGEDAVAAVQSQRYDLVLMDCQMPVMDGFNATRAIRRMASSSLDSHRIPIIALTANAVSGDRERCVEAGMDDYLTKPLNPSLLLKTLLQHLPLQDVVCIP